MASLRPNIWAGQTHNYDKILAQDFSARGKRHLDFSPVYNYMYLVLKNSVMFTTRILVKHIKANFTDVSSEACDDST